MQTCTGCGQTKEAESFGFRNAAIGSRHRMCKTCVAEYGRKHYAAHKATYVASSRRNSDARRRDLADRVLEHLRAHVCVDCGEADPLVLDFDHIDPGQKRSTIYRLVHHATSWALVEAEIAKCQVRCANCHHRRTARQFGWAKIEFANTPELQSAPAKPESQERVMRPSGIPRPRRTDSLREPTDDGFRFCVGCGVTKQIEAFHLRSEQSRARQDVCGDCLNAYRREHYRLYRDEYIERNVEAQRRRRREWQWRLWLYLIEHPCVDCGEADPVALQFDHRDPITKRATLRFMSQRAYAWITVAAEIAKCDVRCANCHRRRTATQFNWPKLQEAPSAK